jgi:DNA-3-methyladenine glycosylase
VATSRSSLRAPRRLARLRRAELPTDTAALARFLIGKVLVRDTPAGRTSGRIVETEAYVIGDAACHAFRGATPRNRSLFLERGRAYVYLIYGTWYCMNVSGEMPGIGAGVLLRALDPLEGIGLMEKRRASTRAADLTRGPGRLAAAMAIDRSCDGIDLCTPGPLWLGRVARPEGAIGLSTRIGLSVEANRLLRFYERGNPFVSGPARLRT